MSIGVIPGTALAERTAALAAELAASGIAGAITRGDGTAWGPAAESEASKRLGWVNAPEVSAPLVPRIIALREEFAAAGITRFVLGGMGGSSLAPEVITRTAGVSLTVLDSTVPTQVAAAFSDPEHTVVVVSSKSGSTVETDSHKRFAEKWFADAGIDPAERIVIVTDPGSPLEASATEAGYRVFTADPLVGGRFSALTAFGLVPSGLAGADIETLLADAAQARAQVAPDTADNPAIVLAAALAGRSPEVDKVALVSAGTPIVGFPDWAEQLVAESLGKEGTGILPVVLGRDAPEIEHALGDITIARLVADAGAPVAPDEVHVFGSLGGQLVLWEYAISIVGKVLGINPFDQPDVESAKVAARALLADRPAPIPAAISEAGIEARGTASVLDGATSIAEAIEQLFSLVPASNGYVSIHAYLDRPGEPEAAELRDAAAAATGRPVTFGWGPRFLHSSGQYHKGGPAEGVYLQITAQTDEDLPIPGIPFTFGELVVAQAAGDASVLAEHGRPVLSLHITGPVAPGIEAIRGFLTIEG